VGVFKPKDEEPYGNQNPKWTKWLHRNLLCCCFGRSCVIPNVGYISEVAASYIDRRLGLGIVPRTELVQLSSPSFNYSFTQRWSHRLFKTPLPTKKGSFQIFVRGYEDSASFFESQPQSSSEWNEDVQAKFQIAFERLVILDYLIRNTDRGSDNWLLRFDKSDVALPEYKSAIQIAAIDNGLAFPIHHPNRIRSYPYGWLSLPIAATPFSIENTRAILHCLMSSRWWQETLNGIEFLFKLDSDFKSSQFKLQRSVMRGQCYNMVECLMKLEENPESPVKLTQMPLVIVHEEELTAWDKIKGKLETLSQIAMFKNC
jgi:phosphatidylinositol 4-kinase type 2